MKKKIFFMISFAALILVGCSEQEEDNAEKSIPVKIYEVKTESISNYVRATGSISGDEDVILYGKVAERVEKIAVVPGQSVSKNQILVEQKNDIQKQGLDIAIASLKTAEAQAKLSKLDFDRMEKLYSEKAISSQQYDQARTTRETVEHSLEQAKSMYEQAKEQYDNTFTKAPFNGVVAAVYVEKKEMVNMGQSIVQVVSPSKMKSKIYLTGEDILNVKAGQDVVIKFPTITGEEFSGKVEKINSAIDQMSKTLEAEIVLTSKDPRIKSGLFGEYLIEIKTVTNSLVVPEVALIPQTEIIIDRNTGLQKSLKKFYIFVVKNGKATMKEVKTGIINNGQVEIKDGLSAGDSVIIVGQNIVKEGQTVNVIE